MFLVALGLRWCTRAFSSCEERGLLSSCGARASLCGGFPSCRAWALGTWTSVAVAQGLISCSWRPLEHVGFSSCGTQAQLCACYPVSPQARDQTCVPCYWQADSYPLHHQGNPFTTFCPRVRSVLGLPGVLVVKNLPSNARDTGSISGQGTKVPQATGQVRLCVTTREACA